MSEQTRTNHRVSEYYADQTIALYIMDCASCGCVFAINTDYEARRRRDGRNFYCPNGHVNAWTEDEADRQAKRAALLAQQLASRDEDLRAARVAHAATKGQLTKVRKRAERGVCLHCQRSFVNVARHVADCHPEQVQS